MRRFTTVLLGLLVVGTTGVVDAAPAPPGPVPPGLIFAADIYAGGQGAVKVRPDGTGYAPSCRGDADNNPTDRRFLRSDDAGALLWSGADCVARVLYQDASAVPGFARWSPDGTRVAFNSTWRELDPNGDLVTRNGISVGDVRADGAVLSLVNVHLGALIQGTVNFTWAPDNATVTYASGTPSDVYVVNLEDGTMAASNITKSSGNETYPSFSPDGTRIAFSKTTVVRGVARSDIFTMAATGGSVAQVTSKANAAAGTNVQPTWSPDASAIGFACGSNSVGGEVHVCRIDREGRTKAVNLTPKVKAYFSVMGWRS